MMKTVLFVVFLVQLAVAQDSPKCITWCDRRLLQWSDFKGQYDSLSQHGAISSTGVKLKIFEGGNIYRFDVYAFFYPQNSWTLYPSDDFLLSHEQVHFNISEVVARKLRKALVGKTITEENVDKVWEETSFLKKKLLKELNDLYDSETSYGQIKAAQIKWKEKIDEELRSLDDFKIDCIDIMID
jgi:hypothetical protein